LAAVAPDCVGRDWLAVDRFAQRAGVPFADQDLVVEQHDDFRDALVGGGRAGDEFDERKCFELFERERRQRVVGGALVLLVSQ
jgi:hypothetical protein